MSFCLLNNLYASNSFLELTYLYLFISKKKYLRSHSLERLINFKYFFSFFPGAYSQGGLRGPSRPYILELSLILSVTISYPSNPRFEPHQAFIPRYLDILLYSFALRWFHFLFIFLFRGPTAAAWGGSLGLVGLFLTDWKVITGKIPYIKEKYNHEIPRLENSFFAIFWDFVKWKDC